MSRSYMEWIGPLTTFGLLLILIGIALVLIPIIVKLIPEIAVGKIPWFLLYIYRKDGFFFATSPLLIIVGIGYFLLAYLRR